MTPRVLIVSDPFTPPAYTPRLRFLCEYLTQAGWEVDLYTEYYGPIPFAYTYPIHEVRIYRTRSLIEWLVKSAWSLLTDWRNRFFSRKVRQATADQHFDLVLCCTFSTFPLRAAWDIARERHIPLHIDLRDLDEQVPGAQYQHHRQWWLRPFRAWYRTVNLRRRNAILRHASSISSVSPWHTEYLRSLTANRSPLTIIATHGHLDHLWGAKWATETWHTQVLMHEADIPMAKAMQAQYNLFGIRATAESFAVENIKSEIFNLKSQMSNFQLLETPGHTPGSVCLYFPHSLNPNSITPSILFSGDTLFQMGYGRTDLPGGNMGQLIDSLERLFELPSDVVVYPGHGDSTTIGAEKR